MSFLPSLGVLGPGFRILRLFRLVKLVKYSKGFNTIVKAFKREGKTLLVVFFIALSYIIISAMFMFSYEPETFNNFFEALYWATTALTTVGYGDVAPVTDVGRLISMVSSLFGIAIIAMPAGIITASFVDELHEMKKKQKTKVHPIEKTKNKILLTLFNEDYLRMREQKIKERKDNEKTD